MTGTKNNRKARRVDLTRVRINATLALLHGNRATGFIVSVRDFTALGAGVYSKIQVDASTPIRFSIQDLNHPAIDGRVIWCGSSSGDPGAIPTHPFRIGIQFVPAGEAARANQLAVFKHLAKLVGDRGD